MNSPKQALTAPGLGLEKNSGRNLRLASRFIKKQTPPRPGLVPQSGDWQNPDRWIRPRENIYPVPKTANPDLDAFVLKVRDDFKQNREALIGEIKELGIDVADLKLIGSYARGTPREDSDIDLLVEYKGPIEPEKVVEQLYNKLHGAGGTYDIVAKRIEPSQQGELLTKPAGQVDKKKLNHMYAAWKMRKSGKELTPREQQFIASSLGEYNKLSNDQLREYFKGQYGALQQQEPRKEHYLDAKPAKINNIKDFKLLLFEIPDEKKEYYSQLLSAARGLREHQPTNPHTVAWIDAVIKGAQKYENTGDIGMMEYASNRAKILFSQKNWDNEDEEFNFTLHGGKKISGSEDSSF